MTNLTRFLTSATIVLIIFVTSMRSAARAESAAPTAIVTGRVANSATGAYLEGANVKIKGTSLAALTDENGRFSISGVSAGEHILSVFYTGLDPFEDPITLTGGQTLNREVGLTASVYMLATFNVAGEREGNAKAITLQRNSDNVRNVVDAEALGDIADGNIGDFLKSMPGVNSEGKNGETWAVRIRGMDPASNSVTVDGFKTAGAQLDSDASRSFDVGVIPIEGISTLEVTKSPLPSQPADSLGGAVNLISRSALDRKYNGPTFSASVGATARSYRNQYAYNGRATFQDQYAIGADTRNLAVSVTASSNDNYIPNNRVLQSWTLNSATGLITGLNEFRVYEARITRRRAGGTLNVDFRPAPSTLIKLRSSVDVFNQKSYENYIGWRAADITAQRWLYWKKRQSENVGLILEHKWDALKLDYGLQTGTSKGRYFDKDNDDHEGGRLLWKLNTTPRYAFVFDAPEVTGKKFTAVRQTSGLDFLDPVNWIANGFRIRNIEFQNDSLNGYLNAQKEFSVLQKYPLKLQAGGSYTELKVRKTQDEKSYTYSGTGGLAAFVVTDPNPYPLYGGQASINGGPYAPQWMSPELANASLRNSPTLWSYNQTTWYNTLLQNDNTLTEGTRAAFTQGTVKFGNLSLLTGIRFESTEVMKRFHQKITDPVTKVSAYQPNRTKRTATYDRYFPGAHLKYSFTPNLLARASYSQSIG